MTNIFFLNKQITARLLAAVTIVSLLLSALPVAFFVALAQNNQDVEKKVDICHWNGTSFNAQNVSVNSIGNAHGASGQNDGDIIPASDSYPGQNLTTTYGNQTGAQVLANGCVVTPPPSVPTVSQCSSVTELVTTNLSTWDLSQTRATGHNEITEDGLRIWTEGNTSTDKAAGYYTTNFPLSGLGTQTVDAALDYQSTVGIEPGLQLVVDFDNNGTPDGILVGEKIYEGTLSNSWWLTGSAAQFVKDNAPNTGGGHGTNWFGTPNGWLAKFPNAQVKAIGYSLGSGVLADGVIKSITLGCVKYTFEIPKAPVCENGENLLANASFETPNPDANSAHGGLWEIFSSVTGWIISSDGLEIWDGLFGGASDGDQNAELDGNQNTNISQLITTIPGATYELKFDFSARPGTGLADNSITAKADGIDVVTASADGSSLTNNSWSPFAGTFVAGDNQTEVKFVDNGTSNSFGSLIDNTALCLVEEPEPVATIVATKIVCEDESLLPNDGYGNITSTTAAEFLASTPERTAGCALVPDWKFQWALNGQDVYVDNQGEQGSPWVTTENTNASGTVKIKIPQAQLGSGKTIAVREVMKTGFLPFTGRDTDQSVSAELYCTGDAANYDNLEWIPNVTATNNYHCVAWNVELPPPAADVTMCKLDEEGVGLNGWQLSLLGKKVETLNVPANVPAGVNTANALTQGTSYVAVTQGTWDNNRGPLNIVDAEYSTENGWMTVMDGFTGYGTDILELQLNSAFDPNSNWGSYNGLHRYARGFIPATTSTQNFRIYDTFHGDNTGSLNVDIYEGYTGITAGQGCVTFQDVPYGTYNADEILKDGWQVVSGVGQVVVDGEQETFNIVNKDISEVPVATIVAEKIVCTDESLLPNWNTDRTAPTITETTAAEFLASTPERTAGCALVPNWQFEWATQNIADPSDTATGTAGVGWNTFGPTNGLGKATVALDADDVDGDSFLWVREVLQSGYIPFTHQATPNNSNNVTAEMYCHTDGLNYDNWDRVDGIEVDETYHCVAFNAEIPEPAPMCTLEVLSSTSTLVVETNDLAVATDNDHPSWTASITDAIWVWVSEYVANPTQQEVYTFEETFTVNNPSSALLDIAADNTYKVFINGDLVVEIDGSNENNYGSNTQKNNRDVLSYLNLTGENTIRVEVTNLAQPGGNAQSNPAGALFRLDIVGESNCKVTTEPEPEAPVKVFETVVIKQSDLKGWVIEESGGGNTEFVLNGTAPLGTGTLNLVSDAAVTARAGASKVVDVKLADLEGLSYKTRQNEAIAEGNAAYRIRFDADGDITTTNDVATLIYEPYWQNAMSPDPAPVVPDVWQTWNVDNGHFWVSVPGGSTTFFTPNGILNGAGGPPFFTLAQIQAFYPNAKVTSFGVHIGSYNPLYNIDVDAVVFGTDVKQSTYDFEPETPTIPVDVCPNLEGNQSTIPQGYEKVGDSNNCTLIPVQVVDVCPNLEGNQSVIPEGFQKVNESNECTPIPPTITPQDTDRNGGGTRTGSRNNGRSGQVLGASTMQCGMYLFDYMKEGTGNDAFEVKKLQWFLIGQGYTVPVTGIFDDATDEAVKAFQLKYQLEVLTPWFTAGFVPHNNPTGWVYQLTRWKINNIVCPGSEAAPVLIP